MRHCLYALLGMLVLMGGCKNRPSYHHFRAGPIAKSEAIQTQRDLLTPTPLDLDTFRFPEDDDDGRTAYAKAVDSALYRDRLRDILIMRADQMYHYDRAKALAFSAGTSASLDLAQTLVAGVGALTTGGTTPRILSGAASMIGATKAIVLEAAYFRVFVPKLLADTERERRTKLDEIYAHTAKPIAKYSVDRMIGDVLGYHESGSLYLAIIRLAQEPTKPESSTQPAGGVVTTQPSDTQPADTPPTSAPSE